MRHRRANFSIGLISGHPVTTTTVQSQFYTDMRKFFAIIWNYTRFGGCKSLEEKSTEHRMARLLAYLFLIIFWVPIWLLSLSCVCLAFINDFMEDWKRGLMLMLVMLPLFFLGFPMAYGLIKEWIKNIIEIWQIK